MRKNILIVFGILLIGAIISFWFFTPSLSKHHGSIDEQLFLGETECQPLVVGFGGGEGGNAWASDYWKETRNQFIEQGYAFLAVGYFGAESTPKALDRISLDAIHNSISAMARHPKIDQDRIIVIGGSKGGELALDLASRYADISTVIAIVPSHVSFPAHTIWANTSSWTYRNQEVSYVPAPLKTISAIIEGDLHEAFIIMLEDEEAIETATIKVEKVNGPILLLSATDDEFWPSTYMCEQIVNRLRSHNFPYPYEHIAIEGRHAEPLKHFDTIFRFLGKHLLTSEEINSSIEVHTAPSNE